MLPCVCKQLHVISKIVQEVGLEALKGKWLIRDHRTSKWQQGHLNSCVSFGWVGGSVCFFCTVWSQQDDTGVLLHSLQGLQRSEQSGNSDTAIPMCALRYTHRHIRGVLEWNRPPEEVGSPTNKGKCKQSWAVSGNVEGILASLVRSPEGF